MDTYSTSAVDISQRLDLAVPGAPTSEKTWKDGKRNDVSVRGKTKEMDVQVYPTTTESTSCADAHADKEGTNASLFTAAAKVVLHKLTKAMSQVRDISDLDFRKSCELQIISSI
jgi:hypothetical protein